MSLPLAWILRVVASAWLDNWSARAVAHTTILEVAVVLVMPVTFVVLSLALAVLPLSRQRARDILGCSLALAGLLDSAAGVGQPGLIGFATAYACAVTVSLAASSSIRMERPQLPLGPEHRPA